MSQQPNLIPEGSLPPEPGRVTPDTSLKAAVGVFQQHMRDEGFSDHTVRAFLSDLQLFGRYIGTAQPIGSFGTNDLNDFLNWLAYERDVPCSPKSYARRVTTLKVFFGWLTNIGTLTVDPSAAVIQRSVISPLPVVPTQVEIDHALAMANTIRHDPNKPDPRPYLLLTLLLKTGIKKGETMAIVPNHIVRESDDGPYLYIRYKNPRLRYKERKVPIDHAWLVVLDEYLTQYEPTGTLFTCTARNLEYVLSDVAETAGLAKGALSFENLRWVSALRDYLLKVDENDIRQRLGLSKITWRDTARKLAQLGEKYNPPLTPEDAAADSL